MDSSGENGRLTSARRGRAATNFASPTVSESHGPTKRPATSAKADACEPNAWNWATLFCKLVSAREYFTRGRRRSRYSLRVQHAHRLPRGGGPRRVLVTRHRVVAVAGPAARRAVRRQGAQDESARGEQLECPRGSRAGVLGGRRLARGAPLRPPRDLPRPLRLIVSRRDLDWGGTRWSDCGTRCGRNRATRAATVLGRRSRNARNSVLSGKRPRNSHTKAPYPASDGPHSTGRARSSPSSGSPQSSPSSNLALL